MRLVSILAAISASLTAQVYVVDANNGAGTHFTDLPAAIAAVPDGATLRVRAGSYTPFTLQNKGLRIVGEGSVQVVRLSTRSLIGPLAASHSVLLRNLDLGAEGLQIADAAGPVVIDSCRATVVCICRGSIEVDRCANVQMHSCMFDSTFLSGAGVTATDSTLHISRARIRGANGSTWHWSYPAGAGAPALFLTRSRCVVWDSILTGGDGGDGCCRTSPPPCLSDSGNGAAACRVIGSTLLLLNAAANGGNGGTAGCRQGDGGPGIELQNGTLVVLGTQPMGGGGVVRGLPIQGTGQNFVLLDGNATPPSGHIAGSQARGQGVSFTVAAPNGTVAVLALSYRGVLLPLDALGIWGSLLASPALTIGPTLVTTNDRASLPVTLPNDLPLGEVYFGQFVTLTNQRLYVSNTFPLLAAN